MHFQIFEFFSNNLPTDVSELKKRRKTMPFSYFINVLNSLTGLLGLNRKLRLLEKF